MKENKNIGLLTFMIGGVIGLMISVYLILEFVVVMEYYDYRLNLMILYIMGITLFLFCGIACISYSISRNNLVEDEVRKMFLEELKKKLGEEKE